MLFQFFPTENKYYLIDPGNGKKILLSGNNAKDFETVDNAHKVATRQFGFSNYTLYWNNTETDNFVSVKPDWITE